MILRGLCGHCRGLVVALPFCRARCWHCGAVPVWESYPPVLAMEPMTVYAAPREGSNVRVRRAR